MACHELNTVFTPSHNHLKIAERFDSQLSEPELAVICPTTETVAQHWALGTEQSGLDGSSSVKSSQDQTNFSKQEV